MSESERPESHQKGERHEREARNILSARYRAERVPSIYGNNDPFRLADIMGLRSGFPFALIQVKTNRFTAEDRRYYRDWSRDIDGEHTIFEVWVRHDRSGWEMYRVDPESREFERYYQTGTCAPDSVRKGWRDAFMRSLDTASSQGGSDA